MATQTNGGMLDYMRNDKVEREVEDEWEVVHEEGVEQIRRKNACHQMNNWYKNRRNWGRNTYGKRARMVSGDDLVLNSTICLDADIQQENIQQNNFPKSYCIKKEDERK